jgi:hypothetical protein
MTAKDIWKDPVVPGIISGVVVAVLVSAGRKTLTGERGHIP